jgi:glycosyltransferase involved in cell wall biosynthesis
MKNILCISTHLYPTVGFGGPSVSFDNFLNFLEANKKNFTAVSATNIDSYSKGSKNYLRLFFKSRLLLKYGFSIRLFTFIYRNRANYDSFVINGITNFPLFFGILVGYYSKKKVFIFTRGGLETSRLNEWNNFKKFYYNLNIKFLRKINTSKNLFLVYQSKDEKNKSCLEAHNTLICSNYSVDNFKNIKKDFKNLNVLYVGRFSAEKGSDRLLRFLDYFNDIPNRTSKIFLAIASNEEIYDLKKYNHNKRISIQYNLNKSQLDELYQNTNVIFFPSYKENFGNALVEGVINGLVPVVYEDTHWSSLLNKSAALNENELRKAINMDNIDNVYFSTISKNAQLVVVKDFIEGNDFGQVLMSLS